MLEPYVMEAFRKEDQTQNAIWLNATANETGDCSKRWLLKT